MKILVMPMLHGKTTLASRLPDEFIDIDHFLSSEENKTKWDVAIKSGAENNNWTKVTKLIRQTAQSIVNDGDLRSFTLLMHNTPQSYGIDDVEEWFLAEPLTKKQFNDRLAERLRTLPPEERVDHERMARQNRSSHKDSIEKFPDKVISIENYINTISTGAINVQNI